VTASCPSTDRVRWSRVPRPRLVVLDGEDHMAQAGDVHAWLDHVEVFVTGMVSSASPPTQRVRPAMRTMGGFRVRVRSEEHTSELQSLMRISYAVFCLKK